MEYLDKGNFRRYSPAGGRRSLRVCVLMKVRSCPFPFSIWFALFLFAFGLPWCEQLCFKGSHHKLRMGHVTWTKTFGIFSQDTSCYRMKSRHFSLICFLALDCISLVCRIYKDGREAVPNYKTEAPKCQLLTFPTLPGEQSNHHSYGWFIEWVCLQIVRDLSDYTKELCFCPGK